MKATELMINDWVCLVGDVDYEYPVRVEVMDMSADILITSDRDDVGFEGVMPIPLTEDIMKKGWENPLL